MDVVRGRWIVLNERFIQRIFLQRPFGADKSPEEEFTVLGSMNYVGNASKKNYR